MNKSHLKRLAAELRSEIGLGPLDVLDPYRLASLYGVDVYQLRDLDCAEAMRHFRITRPEVFSGALVPLGSGAVIVENDAHDLARKRATAAHEMAHVALEHRFTTTLVNERGCRTARADDEAAAAELGGELLIPFDAAKRLAWLNTTDEEAAHKYVVSVSLARWRLNATGARRIAQRARSRQA